MKFTNGILAVEPKNHQAVDLKNIIEKKMRNGKQFCCTISQLAKMSFYGHGVMVTFALVARCHTTDATV